MRDVDGDELLIGLPVPSDLSTERAEDLRAAAALLEIFTTSEFCALIGSDVELHEDEPFPVVPAPVPPSLAEKAIAALRVQSALSGRN